jgi:hypothetical protein
VHVDAVAARVERYEVLLKLANAANRTLQRLFDEDPFLGVNYLIVALFQISVNVNVLDVETCEVLEDLVRLPAFDVLQASLCILVRWYILHLYLFLEIIHGIRQL